MLELSVLDLCSAHTNQMVFPIPAIEMWLLKWIDNTAYNIWVTDNDHSLFMFSNYTNIQCSYYFYGPETVVNALYAKGLYYCPSYTGKKVPRGQRCLFCSLLIPTGPKNSALHFWALKFWWFVSRTHTSHHYIESDYNFCKKLHFEEHRICPHHLPP